MVKNEGRSVIDEQIAALEKQAEVLKQRKAYEQAQSYGYVGGSAPPKEQQPFFATIPKKTAALEVLKQLKVIRLLGIGSMVGVFLLLLLNVFGKFPMYIGAAILIVPAAVMAARSTQEIKRLCFEYDIK